MPNLTFVLPHWLYWATLLFIPLLIMGALNRRRTDDTKPKQKTSLGIAYLLWVTGGFIGLHRFYLKSLLGWIFIPLFIGILFSNIESRTARDEISRTHNDVVSGEFLIERAQKRIAEGRAGAETELSEARQLLATAETEVEIARANVEKWENNVQMLAIAIIVLMLIDTILMPKIYRRCLAKEAARTEQVPIIVNVPTDLEFDGVHATAEPPVPVNLFSRIVNSMNEFTGNFVAYWSIIAVFVYYYEVVARYVFNSPTNWAHESMFLMFGMQYLLAGGYVLRHNGHVRVDVFYMHFSARTKALVDVLTSTFFFIFAITLLWTGWIFFMDSYDVWEVSFTEWAIQYWPVKLSIPIGAALLLLQGLTWLMNDIAVLMRKEA